MKGLTDPSQVPVREWVSLEAEHRQAIETRLDHNAAGTEPAKNPALVDELAAQMTETPHAFARRDLVPAVAHLPLAQWRRFHDWQAGLQRDDIATEDQLDAVKRGLQLANKMLPADMAEDEATTVRARLVEDIAIRRRITGSSPDDADIAGMLARHGPSEPRPTHTLEWDPRTRAAITPLRFTLPPPQPGDPPGIHRVDTNRMTAPGSAALAELRVLVGVARRAIIDAQRALADAATRVAKAKAAAQAAPAGSAIAARAAEQALREIRAWEAIAKEHAELEEWEADLKAAMLDWSYEFSGQRFPPRIAEKNEIAEAAKLGFVPTDAAPIDAQGRRVFVNPSTGQYIVRAIDPRTPGAWELFDADLEWQGFRDRTLQDRYPDPPLKQFFPNAVAMTPVRKRYQKRLREWQKESAAAQARGDQIPPPPEDPDETPEAKAKRKQEEKAKAKAKSPDPSRPWREGVKLTPEEADTRAKELGYERTNNYNFKSHGQAVYWNRKTKTFISPDTDTHSVGTWKQFDRSGKRIGTMDNNLKFIKK